jgi:dipeptidyl aminopeptidase/acylaminoacyl peptidase
MDARNGKRMYLLNYVVDSLYRPVLLSYFRDSPADTNDVMYKPVIFDVDTQKMTKIDLPEYHHYMTVELHWTPDSKYIYGLYYHRGYKKMDVLEADLETGKVKTIWTDNSKTYVEPKTQFRYLEDKGIAFITSEKSGWNQLYRLNWNTGKIHPVTHRKYVVKKILSVDTTNKKIYFTAAGREKGVNPYYNSLYKISFDGKGLKQLTPEPVDHEVSLSPGDQYFVDNSSTAIEPTVSLLRNTEDGKTVMKIDSADVKDLRKMDWRPPKVFTATARDGKTSIYGILWKPTNFDPHLRYPVIDFTYTGPQMFLFNNTFTKTVLHSYDQYSPYYPSAQALAELGFIVIEVDGLGSAGRSKAFHNWSYEDLGNNLKDHVRAIKQLGRKYSWIDTTRVGIYGHSAGGYDAAHALEAFNKTYKVAISESADHDWRMEKASCPELYVGWPAGENYRKQNNIAMAPKLKGDLLLIHGALDQNVNPSATFRLTEALIKAGKYFDELIIPSAHHHYLKYHAYVTKKRWHFFVRHLIVDPPE